MTTTAKPAMRPARPEFSSGPCAKRPGWNPQNLSNAVLGRSHRSKLGKARLKEAIDRTREVLDVPADYLIGIVPGSDTGAVEMAMWSMLGARPVQLLAFESFGKDWVTDVTKQLKLPDVEVLSAAYGELPDLAKVDPAKDLVFTWNGTTSGVRVPNADFISADREGVVICDATSAAFAMPLEWDKLDTTTFSFQKALGGDAGIGVLVLSPRAVERLDSHAPAWPVPKVLRLRDAHGFDRQLAEAVPINTYSILALEDWMACLAWAEAVGGLPALVARTQANFRVLADWVERTPWIDFLARDPATRSETSVCLRFTEDRAQADGFARGVAAWLKDKGAALDVESHRAAPPGLRIWCGATVETEDVRALLPWLDLAYAEAL